MKIECVWEHNGNDTLLYAANLPGAYARGESLEIALSKMREEAECYLKWTGSRVQKFENIQIIQEAPCELEIADADSDVLFNTEKAPLTLPEYLRLKALVLKSAADFLTPWAAQMLTPFARDSVPTTARAMALPRQS